MEGDRPPPVVGVAALRERRPAVERVTDDRHAAGGGLHPQLVHPAGEGRELEEPSSGRYLPEGPDPGHPLASRRILQTDDRRRRRIGAFRNPVAPFDQRSCHRAESGPGGHDRDVGLCHLAPLELSRKLAGGAGCRRHEEDARHGAVETVGHAKIGTSRKPVTEPRLDRRESGGSLGGEAEGLGKRHDSRPFEEDRR